MVEGGRDLGFLYNVLDNKYKNRRPKVRYWTCMVFGIDSWCNKYIIITDIIFLCSFTLL